MTLLYRRRCLTGTSHDSDVGLQDTMRAAKKKFKHGAAGMADIEEDREKVRELYARYTPLS